MTAAIARLERMICHARGTLRAWRVARKDVWEPGDGPGRWHRPGDSMLYASTTAALAVLEARAHLEAADARRPHVLSCFCVELEPGDVACLDAAALPADWKRRKSLTRALGSQWLAAGWSAALLVPSALAPGELNVLIDPAHPRTRRWLRAAVDQPFRFDPRLLEADA